MSTDIHSIRLGIAHSYIICNRGAILVDAGSPGMAKRFRVAMEGLRLDPRSILLIVITHGHMDHIGSAKEIQELTGAPIAMHVREVDWLERPTISIPPPVTAWGYLLTMAMRPLVPFVRFPPAHVDIAVGDEGMSLAEYGIPGSVLWTPGHSMGSLTVLLDSGDAFVGDLAMSGFPLRLRPGLPIFAEDLLKAKASWRHLLKAGAKTIYPSHGQPFSAELMRCAVS